MKFGSIGIVMVFITALSGCASLNLGSDQSKKIALSQVEIDLMIQKAKEEERLRIQAELDQQESQKIVFDEMLIRQGQAPKFSNFYRVIREKSQNPEFDISPKKVNDDFFQSRSFEINNRGAQAAHLPENFSQVVYSVIPVARVHLFGIE